MGKADLGSAKYQSKQLKASGLQKLRFYCQLCSKQCRDANGFKNHLGSPSHMGRVSNLSESGKSGEVIDAFSSDFEKEFLRLLRVNHGTKKISANKFYQEYILNDKDHVHMNATRWNSLTAFVKYLGRAGKVRVEIPPNADDEFNLFIRLVDSAAEFESGDKRRNVQSEEDQMTRFLDSQVAWGKALAEQNVGDKSDQDSEEVSSKPVAISLKGISVKKNAKKSVFGAQSDDEDE